MTATRYELVEMFDVVRVHPDRDSIHDLIAAAKECRSDEGKWTVNGSCVEFKSPMGSKMTPIGEQA